MSILVNTSFGVGAPVPLDDRQVLTFAQMKAMNDNVMPEVYQATCVEDGCIYLYNKTNEIDETLGKFRKLVFDGEDKITEDITANCEVGGIQNGTEFTAETSVTDILIQLLTKYYPAEVTLTSDLLNTVVKKGTSLEGINLTANVIKKSNAVTEVTFEIGEETYTVSDDVSNGGTFNYTTVNPITENTSIEVTVDDGKQVVTDNVNINFVDPIYYGVSDIADVASVDGLTEIVELPGTKNVSFSANNQYLVFVTTSTVKSIKDVNNFENIGSFTKDTVEIDGTTYNVYISGTPVTSTDYAYTFVM